MKYLSFFVFVSALGAWEARAEEPAILEAKVVTDGTAMSKHTKFEDVLCRNGAHIRRVELKLGATTEVVYKKETEAPQASQVLYSGTETYCVTQAQAFVERLEGWGWKCEKA